MVESFKSKHLMRTRAGLEYKITNTRYSDQRFTFIFDFGEIPFIKNFNDFLEEFEITFN